MAVGNGQVQTVVQALSFEEKDQNKIQRDVSATGFIIRAIREANDPIRGAKIGVLCLPPKPGKKDSDEMTRYYDLAVDDFKGQGADVLSEAQVDGWAKQQIDGLHVTV